MIVHIQKSECDVNCTVKNKQLCHDWRGDTIKEEAELKDAEPKLWVFTELRDSEVSSFALNPEALIDIKLPMTRRFSRNCDSRGRFSSSRGSEKSELTQYKKLVMHSLSHHRHPSDQVPCKVFDFNSEWSWGSLQNWTITLKVCKLLRLRSQHWVLDQMSQLWVWTWHLIQCQRVRWRQGACQGLWDTHNCWASSCSVLATLAVTEAMTFLVLMADCYGCTIACSTTLILALA